MGLFNRREEAYLRQEIERLQQLLLEQTAKNAKLQEQASRLQDLTEKVQEPWREKLQQMTAKYKGVSELLQKLQAENYRLKQNTPALSKMTAQYNILLKKYQQVEGISERFQELQTAYDRLEEENYQLKQDYPDTSQSMPVSLEQTSEERCNAVDFPLIHVYDRRKTSLEIWMEKLQYACNKSTGDKSEAEKRAENCKKGLKGENCLKDQLLKIMTGTTRLGDAVVVLQDVCFYSSLSNNQWKRKRVQIDFLMITDFVIFVLDSKFRNGVEAVNSTDKKAQDMRTYKNEIMTILSRNGIAQKYGIEEERIYSILAYSGRNEVNHSGISVKSTDAHSGYCEVSDEIQYVFADNLIHEMEGIYSHAARKCLDSGSNRLNRAGIMKATNEVLEYISENGYDNYAVCPLCGYDMEIKSGKYGPFRRCTKKGCTYTESVKQTISIDIFIIMSRYNHEPFPQNRGTAHAIILQFGFLSIR